MSIRAFDFQCANGHTSERFVCRYTRAVRCRECSLPALRLVAAPQVKLEGITGAFPSASDKWVRNRESKMAQEKRNMENHATYK